jgi:hypothetical protein
MGRPTMGKGRAVVVAALLVAVPVLTVHAGAEDPSSDEDYPDTFPAAHAADDTDTVSSSLEPEGDADWLAADAGVLGVDGGPSCVELEVQGDDALADLHASALGTTNHSLVAQVNPDHEPLVGLPATELDEAVYGLEPLEANQSTGNWTLDVRAVQPVDVDGDGGTGRDAPSLDGDPLEVRGPCIAGTVGDDDPADAYAFDAVDTQRIALASVDGGADIQVDLVDPEGTLQTTIDAQDDGSVTLVDVPTNGTWSIEVTSSSSDAVDYLVGLSLPYDEAHDEDDCDEDEEDDCDDDDRRCRPYCMLLD